MKTLFTVEQLNFNYLSANEETPVLQNISFRAKEGEFIGIVGPSGCGKSTLLSILAGLQTPTSGSIIFTEGFDKTKDIGYMLQRDHLFPWMSIRENALLGPTLRKTRNAASEKLVDDMLQKYGLETFANQKPGALSGGMRQRVALIRTLANHPRLLLLDEPFSALDYQTRIMVSMDICSMIREQHKSMILITHDLSEAITLCDKIIVLSKRPATIIRTLHIHLTKQDESYLAARNAPEFNQYFSVLWEDLCHDT